MPLEYPTTVTQLPSSVHNNKPQRRVLNVSDRLKYDDTDPIGVGVTPRVPLQQKRRWPLQRDTLATGRPQATATGTIPQRGTGGDEEAHWPTTRGTLPLRATLAEEASWPKRHALLATKRHTCR